MNQHIPLSNIINKLQRKELLLKLEYDYEKETFRQQTEAMGIGRKVKRGMCWYPISAGRSYYNSLNQLVVEVERQEDFVEGYKALLTEYKRDSRVEK